MTSLTYKQFYNLDETGIAIKYYTEHGYYTPPHWHSALELIFVLNGTAQMTIDGRVHSLIPGEFVLIDSNQIHESRCAAMTMGLCIHISRQHLLKYLPDLDRLNLCFSRELLEKKELSTYLEICELLKRLPPLYIQQPPGYRLECESVAMHILYLAANHLARPVSRPQMPEYAGSLDRLERITSYVEQHYAEPISLETMAGELGLSREYFCRFFKQHMGVTFLHYVNQIRLIHIHYDLCRSHDGIMEIAERHGFTNYKLFNRMFKEIYGCTPRSLRKDGGAALDETLS